MGASAGPNLVGIGRGGDSNLVLEMDAHDAKSYPGEPTTNLYGIVGQSAQNNGNHTGTIVTGQPVNFPVPLKTFVPGTMAPPLYSYYKIVATGAWSSESNRCLQWAGTSNFAVSTSYHMSFWARTDNPGSTFMYSFYGGGGGRNYGTLTGEWQFFSCQSTTQATYLPLEIVSTESGGQTYYVAAIQVEDKAYATPYTQYEARPASVNLMIHGNVGTDQSFSDSSPSKHTITANGDVTHSGAQSKFSGGSIYFDGSDSLSIAGSTDFDFGTGDFTVDCWSNVTSSYSGYNTVWENGLYTDGILFRLSSSYLQVYINGTSYISYAGSWSADTWYHLALLRTGTTLRLFVDGVQRATATVTADIQPSNNAGTSPAGFPNSSFVIGRSNHDANQWFTGLIDEFRVTKGTALWKADFTPPTRRNLSAPVVDRSGNHNGINLINGTDSGGTTYRVGEVIRPIDTAVWDFDGTDDYAIAGDSDDWNFGTGAFAIEQWLRFTDFSPAGDNWSASLQQYASEGDRNGWMVFYSNTQEWRLECTAASPAFFPGNIVTGCSLNTWYLFTISREGSIFKQYIDGVLRQTDTSNPTFDNIAGPMYVGNYAAGDLHEFQGQMGALRIYKGGALTDQQVKENFNQQRSRFDI